MTDAIIVFCTVSNEEDALRMAEALVESRLAACVNILPRMQSVYRWEGKMERANELLLLIKAPADGFRALRARIVELHSYQVPEILAVRVEQGLAAYLDWIRDST